VGVDRQRHRRIVAVPGRDDVHWHAAGQHKADAGITEAPWGGCGAGWLGLDPTHVARVPLSDDDHPVWY
jgi:hypothetical protein